MLATIGVGVAAPAQTLSRPSKCVLRAIYVFEALQRLRAQREAQAGSLWGVHSTVRSDIERLIEQFPHHRHVALAHLQDMTVRRGHGHVDTGGEQDTAAPGVWRQSNAMCRGEGRNTANFCKASGTCDVGLCNIEGVVVEQILEVKTGEFPLARGDGNRCGASHLGLAVMVIRRYWLLEPGNVVGF